mmetsp:Transcript_11048/g.23003  ORF Transcript_11048/g.23003 Transcript_11048/m.23003 type:complete len:121 (+) Transcript_11048:1969-2331(+)
MVFDDLFLDIVLLLQELFLLIVDQQFCLEPLLRFHRLLRSLLGIAQNGTWHNQSVIRRHNFINAECFGGFENLIFSHCCSLLSCEAVSRSDAPFHLFSSSFYPVTVQSNHGFGIAIKNNA